MNNYYNYRPNVSYIRSVPNMNYNLGGFNNMRTASSSLVGLPRLSSLFSGGSRAIGGASAINAAGNGAFSKITFSSFLSGASKTLGVINQAIPVFYQVKPIWNNAKTMFRVVKEINSGNTSSANIKNINSDNSSNGINNVSNKNITNSSQLVEEKKEDNSPTFFI